METKLFFSYFLLNLFFKFIYGDPLLIEIGNSTSGSINESLIPLYYKFLVSSNLTSILVLHFTFHFTFVEQFTFSSVLKLYLLRSHISIWTYLEITYTTSNTHLS